MRPRILISFLIVLALPTPLLAFSLPMRITGVFLSTDDDPGEYYPTLSVSIDGQPWTLHLRDSIHLVDGSRGERTLRAIGFFFVLTGPRALLDYIRAAETQGLPLQIEGRLYLKKRVFMLMAVEPAKAQFKEPTLRSGRPG